MEFLKNLNWPLILGVGVGGIALVAIARNAQGAGQESADVTPTFFSTGDVGGFAGAGPITSIPNAASDSFPGIADAIKNLSDTTSVAIANNTKLQEAALSQGTQLGQLQIIGDIARQNIFKLAPGQSFELNPTAQGGISATSRTAAQNNAVVQNRQQFNEAQRQKIVKEQTENTIIRTNTNQVRAEAAQEKAQAKRANQSQRLLAQAKTPQQRRQIMTHGRA